MARADHDAPAFEVKQIAVSSPILSNDTAADILGLSIKEFLNVLEVLRKKIHKVVSKVNPGGTSPAAQRYAIHDIDDLIGELQACKAHLETME